MYVRAFAALAAGAGLVLLAAAPASAHVSANPDSLVQGSYGKVGFRVPNEMDSADTVQLEVDLPTDHPIVSVSARSMPGWTVSTTKAKLPKPVTLDDGDQVTEAITKIVWSKGSIPPGQFQEFDVSLGPLPTDTDTLSFKAYQTYSDGQKVAWDQPTPAGGAEPEHPAPTVRLTKPGATAAPPALTSATSGKATSGGDDGTARWLGGLGLAAGTVGIVVGVYGMTRGRRAT